MAFVSKFCDSMPIIGDDNYQSVVGGTAIDGEEKTCGYKPRDWSAQPFGSFAEPLDMPLIPRDEWKERIEEQERTKSSLVHLLDHYNIPVKDQNGTNYCWINAPVHAVEVVRAIQGQKYVSLSPASCGALIKGYRNVGGWGSEGLRYIVEHGVAPTSTWPDNGINRQYDNEESRTARQNYKVTEWYDVVDVTRERPTKRFDRLMTCLLLNIPVAIGLNWWGHEVLGIAGAVTSSGFGAVIDNSWGTRWGDKGRSILTESKATPDDAIAPRVTLAA